MNVGDERSISYWMHEAPVIDAPPLATDETCDVVVIGSGIAGLSTAYELSRFGRSVIVIDRGGIGNGMTAAINGETPLVDLLGQAQTQIVEIMQGNGLNAEEAR